MRTRKNCKVAYSYINNHGISRAYSSDAGISDLHAILILNA